MSAELAGVSFVGDPPAKEVAGRYNLVRSTGLL
jgi:hypothetical protein